MAKRLILRVHGRVQGVGYRAFAARAARRFGVRGWVRNLADGTVEAFGEAEDGALTGWVEQLREGPAAGLVTRIDETVGGTADEPMGFALRF